MSLPKNRSSLTRRLKVSFVVWLRRQRTPIVEVRGIRLYLIGVEAALEKLLLLIAFMVVASLMNQVRVGPAGSLEDSTTSLACMHGARRTVISGNTAPKQLQVPVWGAQPGRI